MRCLLPLVVLLGATQAVPFFRLRFGPEHRTGPEGGVELPPDPLSQEVAEPLPQDGPEPFSQQVPEDSAAVFALHLPKIDLSDIFRPLRVFAGVNVDHPAAVAVREEEPNCDLGKFDLTDEEFDVVMDCQKLVGGDEVGLKECILAKLPKTTIELRDFLDREEFGVAGLSSSFHLSLLNGEFTQKRSVQFRLCPRDEVNSIDGEPLVPVVQQVVPVVEELVPIEALNPDRVDPPTEPEVLVAPPHRPLFQLPELKLPDFGEIFSQALAPVLGPRPAGGEGNTGLGLFGSHLNPFAVSGPPATAGPQHGFFASLFPAVVAAPPDQGHPDGVDMSDCVSKKFEVSRFVFNVANRCQYANDYRKCLRMDLANDQNATELLKFAADPNYSVVASSFSSFQSTFDLETLSSGKGLLDLKRKNQIDLRRCPNIAEETTEQTVSTSEPTQQVTEGVPTTPEAGPEVTAEAAPHTVPEEIPGAESSSESTSNAEVAPDVAPEVTPEVTPDVAPEVPSDMPPEVTPEVFEAVPEAPVEPAIDAEKTVEAEKASAEAEKAVVDAEAPVATVKAPVEAEKAPVEAEKDAAEAQKATVGVENPAEETTSQTTSTYDIAEP